MPSVILAVFATSLATWQVPAPPPTLSPAVDSAKERAELRTLGLCLADARPEWARQTLASPYLGDRQTADAGKALSGSDTCLKGDQQEFTFRTSGIVASLAEAQLRRGLDAVASDALTQSMRDVPAANSSEDFALCLATRDPQAARTLAFSEPGSAEETAASARFAAHIRSCTARGEALAVDQQALRGLVTIALYRGYNALPGR